MAARGELAGAGEPGRAGADHGDPEARRPPRGGEAVRPSVSAASAAWRWSRPISIGSRPSWTSTQAPSQRSSVGHTRAQVPPSRFSAKITSRGQLEVAVGDRGDERRYVDVGGAGDRAGCRSVRAAALEAAIGLDHRLQRVERRLDLLEQRALGLGCDGHIDIVSPEALHYIVGFTDTRCVRLRMNTDVCLGRRCKG